MDPISTKECETLVRAFIEAAAPHIRACLDPTR
jgi:hypothetical protein